MYFKSYLGRRAASCWALPHISSLIDIDTDIEHVPIPEASSQFLQTGVYNAKQTKLMYSRAAWQATALDKISLLYG